MTRVTNLLVAALWTAALILMLSLVIAGVVIVAGAILLDKIHRALS